MTSKWESFSKELGKLFQFWIFGIIFFFAYRLSFILLFRAEIQEPISMYEYVKVLFTGFRTDGIVLAYFLILPLAALLILSPLGLSNWASRVRRFIEALFLFFGVTISLVSLNYYNEFHVNFDNNLYLGLFEEDFLDVAKMMLNQENSIMFFLAYLGLFLFVFLLYKHKPKKSLIGAISLKQNRVVSRVLVILVTGLLFTAAIRGSLGQHNFKIRNASVSKVYMLNRSVVNPFKSLEVSFKEYRQRNNILANNPYATATVNNLEKFKASIESINHTVSNENIRVEKPKQVFLVIMESYDSWSLEDKYRPFNVSENLSRIAENGTSFTNFLPAYNATIYAYASIVTSIPYFGVNMAQISRNKEDEDISLFKEFSEMGYKTNFFYGGYISWQKIEDYSLKLSCDNIYSAADVGEEIVGGSWGMEDEKLFDMVLDKINPDEYTFNIILTTSYHNPFPIDVLSKGYPYETKEDLPESVRDYFDGTITLNELGHRWYGDYAIGRFMDVAEDKYSDALYAYTGDHYARKFINANPTLYEKSLVPFILYGKGIPAQKLNTPGSHIDILPTLVELVAPLDHTYKSFGSSMFDVNKRMGIAYDKIVTPGHLYVKIDDNIIEKADRASGKSVVIEQLPYTDSYKNIMELAWYYVSESDKIVI